VRNASLYTDIQRRFTARTAAFTALVLMLFVVTGCGMIKASFKELTSVDKRIFLKVSGSGTLLSLNEGTTLAIIYSLSQTRSVQTKIDVAVTSSRGDSAAAFGTTTASVMIPAGQSSGTVVLSSIHDPLYTGDRDFEIDVSVDDPEVEVSDSVLHLTLKDLEVVPVAKVTLTSQNILENTASGTIEVSLSQGASAAIAVDYSFKPTTATQTADFDAALGSLSGTLTFAPGETVKTVSFNVVDDAAIESTEEFDFELTQVSGAATLSTQKIHTVKIVDNDFATLSFSDVSANEGQNLVFTIILNPASSGPVTVQYATANGTAVSGTNYTSRSGTLTFAAGETSKQITVPSFAFASEACAADRTFSLTLSNATNANIGIASSTGLIRDPDLPSLSVAATNPAGTLESATSTYTASLSLACVSKDVTFTAAAVDGTAKAPLDYTYTSSTYTIPAGSTSVSVPITVIDDALDEDDETVSLVLSAPVNATLGTSSASVKILDNDATPTLSFVSAKMKFDEGVGNATLTATLSAVSGRAVSFQWGTSAGTALPGTDFTTVATTVVTIPEGSQTATLSVPIIDDPIICELPETFTATLTNLTNAVAGSFPVLDATIKDNDLPILTMNSQSVTEGQTANFTGAFSFACPSAITFDYFTVGDTAIEGTDFTRTSGSVSVGAGLTAVSIAVPTSDDALVESPVERFFLSVTNANTAKFTGASYAQADIQDNEGGVATVKVAAGHDRTCALNNIGELKCWGRNFYLGNNGLNRGDEPGEMGSAAPVLNLGTVDGLGVTPHSAASVMRDQNSICVLLDDGRLKCWGNNVVGQAGAGTLSGPFSALGDELSELGNGTPYVNLGTVNGSGAVKHTVKSMASSAGTKCFILNDDRVKCFGNGSGQELGRAANRIGNSNADMGDNLPYLDLGTHDALGVTPHKVKALAGASGGSFCAILDDNRLKCWGNNSSGQLGLGDTLTRGYVGMGDALPYVNLGTGRTVKKIAGGGHFFCAQLDNDGVKCWGFNNDGQLLQGNRSNLGDGVNEMGDALPYVNLGTVDGLGITPNVIKDFSLGSYHACAIVTGDRLKCWGSGFHGVLGLGNRNAIGDDAGEVGDGVPYVNLGTGHTAKAVSARDSTTFVIRDDNTTVGFGVNGRGELGRGDAPAWVGINPSETGNALIAIDFGPGLYAVKLAEGRSVNSTCALLNNSSVKCWGASDSQAAGADGTPLDKIFIGGFANHMGSNLPKVQLPVGTTVIDIQVGGGLYFASNNDAHFLTSNGQVGYWGNSFGDTGDNQGSMGSALVLRKAPGNLKYISISGGYRGGCGIDENHDLHCWGPGLGDEISSWTYYDPSLAPKINFGDERKVLSVVMSREYISTNVCALLDDQSVKCFGNGQYGLLGLGLGGADYGNNPGEMGENAPSVNLGSIGKPVQVVAGTLFHCARFDNGKVKCWGLNNSGQLGLGDGVSRGSLPTDMGDNLPFVNFGSRTAKWIAAGGEHACALLSNNDFVCWGDNGFGQLGKGTTSSIGGNSSQMGASLTAVDLSGAVVQHASLSLYTTCVVLDNSQTKCWGLNSSGQLGQGDLNSRADNPGEMGAALPAIDLVW
jgi:alpha-tubulin suppressor-like RCC1 family protein